MTLSQKMSRYSDEIKRAQDEYAKLLSALENDQKILDRHITFICNELQSISYVLQSETGTKPFDFDKLTDYQYIIHDFGDPHDPHILEYVRECARQNNGLHQRKNQIERDYHYVIGRIQKNVSLMLTDNRPSATRAENEVIIGYLKFEVVVHSLLHATVKNCLGEFYKEGHVINPISLHADNNFVFHIEYLPSNETQTIGGLQQYLAGILYHCRNTVKHIIYLDFSGNHYSLGALTLLASKGYIKAIYEGDEISQEINRYATNASVEEHTVIILRGESSRLLPLRGAIIEMSRNIHNGSNVQLIIAEGISGWQGYSLKDSLPHVYSIEETNKGQVLDNAEFRWLPPLMKLPDKLLDLPEILKIEPPSDNRYVKRIGLPDITVPRERTHQALKVPVAIGDNGEIIEFGFPIATFIGGQPRAGKSTLLNTMLTGLITQYHPDDIEIWLIDFGGGRSFYSSLSATPPHVRYIAVGNSKTPELALNVIDRLNEMLLSRQRRFDEIWRRRKLLHLDQKIENVPIDENVPRIIIFIDEFKVLNNALNNLQGKSIEYKRKINDVLTNGMAYGFSMVIASQTWDDLSIFPPDGSRLLFSNRVSLRQAQASDIKAVVNIPELQPNELDMINHLQDHYILFRDMINGRNRLRRGHVLYFDNAHGDEQQRREYIQSMDTAFRNHYRNKRPMAINIQTIPTWNIEERSSFAVYLQIMASQTVTGEKLYVKPGKAFCLAKEGDAAIALSRDAFENIMIVGSSSYHRQVASMIMSIHQTIEMNKDPSGRLRETPILVHAKCDDVLFKDIGKLFGFNGFGEDLQYIFSCYNRWKEDIRNGRQINLLFILPELSAFLREIPDRDVIVQTKKTNPFDIIANSVKPTGSGDSIKCFESQHDFQLAIRELLMEGPKYGLHFVCTFRNIHELESCVGVNGQELFNHKIIIPESSIIRNARELGLSADEREILPYTSEGIVRYTGNSTSITYQPYEYSGLPFTEESEIDELE